MASEHSSFEKQPLVSAAAISNDSERPKQSSLARYQILVGDIDAAATATNNRNLYQTILREERSANRWFWMTAMLCYTLIAAQIVLCLGIVLGSQRKMSLDTIAILAGVNTGVAAAIGVLKGFGLPEKKDLERNKLAKLADRIRTTTKQLKAGFDVDVQSELDEVNAAFDEVENAGQFGVGDVAAAAEAGFAAGKAGLSKK